MSDQVKQLVKDALKAQSPEQLQQVADRLAQQPPEHFASKETPYQKARAAFDAYAAMDAPSLPADEGSALQVRLARWQTEQFGVQSLERPVRGMSEEIGELSEAMLRLMAAMGKINHASLKHDQKIRGLEDTDKFRALMADALADARVYLRQIATAIRIDDEVNFRATAEEVLKRNWKKNSQDGGAK